MSYRTKKKDDCLKSVPSLPLSYLMEGVTRTGAPGVVQCAGSQRGHTTVAWLSGVQRGQTSTESRQETCCSVLQLNCLY